RDGAVRRRLRALGLRAEARASGLLFEPWQLETRNGEPFRAFTPFWNAARRHWNPPVLSPAPARLPGFDPLPGETAIDALGLQPARGWDSGFWQRWTPGEDGATRALEAFVGHGLQDYADGRDRPAQRLTSRLSPHLHFGEITAARILAGLADAGPGTGREAFVRELAWREFAWHVLHHFPHTSEADFNPRFAGFPWARPDPGLLDAWQRGRTGIPLVDAGMRELWATGWMHNRVRMVA